METDIRLPYPQLELPPLFTVGRKKSSHFVNSTHEKLTIYNDLCKRPWVTDKIRKELLEDVVRAIGQDLFFMTGWALQDVVEEFKSLEGATPEMFRMAREYCFLRSSFISPEGSCTGIKTLEQTLALIRKEYGYKTTGIDPEDLYSAR